MEEAERLCDRVALIDAGKIVAMDTPSALAAGVAGAEMRIRFRPLPQVDDELLTVRQQVGADLVAHGDGCVPDGGLPRQLGWLRVRRRQARHGGRARPGLPALVTWATLGCTR
jgi:hypothetical protein